MKQTICCILFVITSTLIFCINSYSQQDTSRKRIAIFAATGLIGGNDYGPAIEDYFSGYEVSGYLGWLNLEFGLDVNIFDRFLLYPSLKCLVGRVKVMDSYISTDHINIILLPGLATKYYILEKRRSGLFISAGAEVSICSSAFDDFIYRTDGIAKEIALGYEFFGQFKDKRTKVVKAGAMGFRIGFISLPINLIKSGKNEKKDFGGFSFSFYGVL